MSRYASFDDGSQQQIATNSGWGSFIQWSDGLEVEQFPELIHLAEHGWSQNLGKVVEELRKAKSSEDADTEHVVKGLIELLSGRDGAMVVTDGTEDE